MSVVGITILKRHFHDFLIYSELKKYKNTTKNDEAYKVDGTTPHQLISFQHTQKNDKKYCEIQ